MKTGWLRNSTRSIRDDPTAYFAPICDGFADHLTDSINGLLAAARRHLEQGWSRYKAMKWLRDDLFSLGYGYCGDCFSPVLLPLMSRHSKEVLAGRHHSPRCKACMAAQTAVRHATEEGKAYRRRYAKEHPEAQRRASKKYLASERGKERSRAKSRAQYARMRQDPKKWDAYLASMRERYRKRKEQASV